MSTRKIKNAVNNTTGELIYFKGHAQATYMSDGSTVEDAIKNIKPDLSDYVKSEELEGYAKTSDIPSLEGYVQSSELPNFNEFAKTNDIPSIEGLATEEFVTSQGYLTEIPSEYITDSELNAKNYATISELESIDFDHINNTPFTNDESGELNITDETGNIGIKLSEDGIYVKDVIAGEHILSNKQDSLISGSNIKTINGESILGEGNIVVEGGEQDLSEYAKKGTTLADYGITDCYFTIEDGLTNIRIGNISRNFSQVNPIYKNGLNIAAAENPNEPVNIFVPYATENQLGVVKVGEGLSINSGGVLNNAITKTSQLINDSGFLVDDIYPDGIYAVTANEELIDYTTADESCIGVALIAGEHKFMITKEDATNDGSNYKLYWRSDSIEGSLEAKYDTVDGTNGYGYLGGTSTPQLDKNFTNWKSGTLSDFNGKANTEFITTLSNNEKDMCVVLNTFNNGTNSQNNYEYNDWYVPACGQLALMYLNLSEINTALTKIGGIEITNDKYQSSTWYPYNYVCYIDFNKGAINGGDCGGSLGERRVRFIRDLSSIKPLKERVDDLESSKQDKLVSGINIKTINGTSILGSGDITIEGGSIVSGGNIYVWKNPDWLINGQNQGTITEEVYNEIYNADIVYCVTDELSLKFPYDEGGSLVSSSICFTKLEFLSIGCIYLRTLYKDGVNENILNTIDIIISNPLDDYLYEVSYSHLNIPTKTSQLTNDSGFISDELLPDGSYGVKPNGSLCPIDEIDSSCIALAIISGDQKFWIEKSGPSGSIAHAYGTTFIWGSSEDDILGIPNISDNTEDFNGKSNTEALNNQIIHPTDSIPMSGYCKLFNNSDENLGYSDWYIPSKDQLALILNSDYDYSSFSGAMARINGGWGNTDFFDDKYWSSSEKSTTQAWMYCGDSFSGLGITNKSIKGYCILIRDFEVKTIKERISILEEKVNNLSSTNGSSEANVKAVDIGDVLDDVAVNYATTEYVDSVLGDINSILESIINGGNTPTIITFYIEGIGYQAEEGMTWEEFVDSEYNVIVKDGYESFYISGTTIRYYTNYEENLYRKVSDVLNTDMISNGMNYSLYGPEVG